MSERISGSTIRAFVDGELPPEEAAHIAIEAETSETLQRQIDFEGGLRDRVARSLEPSSVPVDLESRVRASMAEPAAPSVIKRSWFAGPARANWLAVAASFALVAGAVLFGVLGKPIDAIRRSAQGSGATEVAVHVASEHRRCAATQDARYGKAEWTSVAAAEIGLTEHLGVPVTVPSLDSVGFQFVGAAPCMVPGPAPSGHLIYVRPEPAPDGCPQTMLSLFILAAPPDPVLGLSGDVWAWSPLGQEPMTGKLVAACSDGQSTYFLASCDESGIAEAARLISGQARQTD